MLMPLRPLAEPPAAAAAAPLDSSDRQRIRFPALHAALRHLWISGNLTVSQNITAGGNMFSYGKINANGKITTQDGFAGRSAMLTATLNAGGACTCSNVKPTAG